MRPTRLVIKGINSYADEQTVDFESIQSYGLFGIFGPTGSGKTTIIDGMTLALYGMGCVARESKDFINSDCDKAFVRLEFLAGRGERKPYLIERVFKRKKGGGTQTDSVRFCHLDGSGEIYERLTDVQSQVERVMGLSDDDFMRSVVLPQGKFSEFLKLKGSERRAMLERLLGLEAYGEQLRVKTNSARSRLEKELEYLRGHLAPFEDVTSEALEGIAALTGSCKNELDQQRRTLSKEHERWMDMKRLLDLTRRYDGLKASVDELTLRQGEIDEKREQLTNARSAAELLPVGKHLEELEAELSAMMAALERIEVEAAENRRLLLESESQYKQTREEYEAYYQPRTKRLAELKQAVALKNEGNRLMAALKEGGQQLLELELEEKLGKERLEQAETSYQSRGTITRDLEVQIGSAGVQSELRQQLSSWTAQSEKSRHMLERRLELSERLLALKSRQILDHEQIQNLSDLKGQQEVAIQALEQQSLSGRSTLEALYAKAQALDKLDVVKNLKESVAALEAQLFELLQLETDYRERLRSLEDRLQQQETLHALHLLSLQLEEGNNCPLCGSQHHPDPYGGQKEERLHLGEESERIVIQQCAEEKAGLQAELTELTGRVATLRAEQGVMQQQINDLEQEAYGLFSKEELSGLTKVAVAEETKKVEDTLETLTEQLAQLRERMAADAARLIELDRSQEERRQEADDLGRQETVAADHLRDVEALAAKLGSEVNAALSKIVAQAELQEFSKVQAYREGDLIGENHACQALVAELDDLRAALEKKLEAERKALSELEGRRLEELGLQSERATQRAGLMATQAALEEQLTGILRQLEAYADVDLESELQHIESWLVRISELLPKNRTAFEALEASMKVLDAQILEASIARKAKAQQAERFEAELMGGIAERFNGERLRYEKAALLCSEIPAMEELLQAFEREKTLSAMALAEVATELQGQRVDDAAYELQQNLVAECTQRVEDLSSELAKLESRAKEWQIKLEEKERLSKQQEALERKLEQVLEIVKLLKGNKFVEFIALGHMKSIAADASRRLLEMTAGRYALEIGADGSFVICDRNAGGVLREANSLSGGETFVTSLALALSLSYHFQLKGRTAIDFFILDEGFGTLDRELLDTVMTALEKLKGDHMMVGVVSHVEEIKQRLPVRLDVTPAVPGLSGSVIRVVKG